MAEPRQRQARWRLTTDRLIKLLVGTEARWADIGIACCVGMAYALAPKDESFLSNAMFYLVSQILVVIIALIFQPRPAAVGGVAIAISLYLAAFWAWTQTIPPRLSGLVWLGYLFSLPGAVLGALVIIGWLKTRPQMASFAAFCISVAAVIVGVSINQAAVCKTVMYCTIPWK
jgi:hypothetical protein